MADCTKCGHPNGEMEDMSVRCRNPLLPSKRSRSRERREKERLEREQAKKPVSSFDDLLHQLDSRAEKRELKMKEEMVRLIDGNYEKWRMRLEEDRKDAKDRCQIEGERRANGRRVHETASGGRASEVSFGQRHVSEACCAKSVC